MKFFYKSLIFALLSVIVIQANGQNCRDYHINNCRWGDPSFFYNRQSRSALFSPGTTSKFKIIVYENEEYYIAINGHRKLGKINIKVSEDNETKEELYDNSNFKFENHFFFQNEKTRKLIVKITTEESSSAKENSKKYCLGVLIEFRQMKGSNKNNNSKDIGF